MKLQHTNRLNCVTVIVNVDMSDIFIIFAAALQSSESIAMDSETVQEGQEDCGKQ